MIIQNPDIEQIKCLCFMTRDLSLCSETDTDSMKRYDFGEVDTIMWDTNANLLAHYVTYQLKMFGCSIVTSRTSTHRIYKIENKSVIFLFYFEFDKTMPEIHFIYDKKTPKKVLKFINGIYMVRDYILQAYKKDAFKTKHVNVSFHFI